MEQTYSSALIFSQVCINYRKVNAKMNITSRILTSKKSLLIWLGMMTTVCLMEGTSYATSVIPLTFDQVVQDAELVIEGTVTKSEPRLDEGSGYIWTDVTFDILDAIKGVWASDEITLSFLGGSIAGKSTQVAGVNIPEIGETGIYFIAETAGNRVQPLMGWHQGHVVIKNDFDGVRRAFTADQQSIIALETKADPVNEQRARAAARGLKTVPGNETATALSVGEFKSLIQQRLSIDSNQ